MEEGKLHITHSNPQQPSSLSISSPIMCPLTPKSNYARQFVEHIVLFQMKKGTDLDTVIQASYSLRRIPGVLYLTCGYVHDIHSSPLDFTIFFLTRHPTKEDIDIYMSHPIKSEFTATYTEPTYQDYIIIDYVYEHNIPLDHPKVGSALRSTFLRLKKGWGSGEKKNVCKVVGHHFGGLVDQHTFGESFTGAFTYEEAFKGYQLGSLAVLPGVKELIALGSPEGFAKLLEEELKGVVQENGILVVDYVVKQVHDASRDALI